MKFLWLLVVSVFGLALAEFGDETYLKQEKDLLLIFKYIHQPHWNEDLYLFAQNYKLWEDYESYNHPEQVKVLVDFFQRDRLLKKYEFFSLYDPSHLEQVQALFNVFYNAKTYETLAKVVAWARFNTNEKLFIYVLGLVISHRPDVKTLINPPPYEVCPYQFFNAEVIKAAQRLKMQGFYGVEKVDGLYQVTIPMNFTGWYMHMNKDQKLTYMTEDPVYNALYYQYSLDYPYWMAGKDYGLDKDRRGEFFIVLHQQILARYYLERLSNGLGEIPEFNWRQPIKSGYRPSLMYVNGKQFPIRPNYYNLYTEGNHKFVQEAEDRERRIRDIVDQGYIYYNGTTYSLSKPEDVNTLGNLMQGNPDNFDLHHNFHDHIVPSFLENPATVLRDPLFYQFYKNLLQSYWKFMSHIPKYTEAELSFKGVKINNVKFDKIETFFEHFDIDITNVLDHEQSEITKKVEEIKEVNFKPDEYLVKAQTVRLNHKPFTYKINVQSDAAQKASIRVFIGPKYDNFGTHIDFDENRKNFVVLDVFYTNLVAGENVITRGCDESKFYVGDRTTYLELYKRVVAGRSGEKPWTADLYKHVCNRPRHLMFPKGKKGGMTYQLYFIINPYIESATKPFSTFDPRYSCGIGSGSRYFETRTMLFPLDRDIDESYFFTPNMHFEDVEIHFNAEENAARYY
jgi:hypothetical protein